VKVVWAPLAEQRALEAVESIAQDRPGAAVAWLDRLLERVQGLEQFEQQGRVVPEIGLRTYREVLHLPYRVIYRVDAARVVILTLRHVRRAWDPTEFGEGV
jgi:plasmid stabilization system protein ParE